MTIQEIIHKSKNVQMPKTKYQNKKYLKENWEYPIQDRMNGILKIRYCTGSASNWSWMDCLVKHCKACSEPDIVMGKKQENMADSYCNKKCKFNYTHPKLEPIEYNGKLYTLEDCNATGMKRLNPIQTHITQLKGTERRSKDLEYMEKDRAKRAKNARKKRKLNPLTEEERLLVNKRNNDAYHRNPQKHMKRQKERELNFTPKQIANKRKVKNKWAQQDRINNYGRYLVQAMINHVIKCSSAGKIKPISKYGFKVKEIREHLVKLANEMGYKDCYSIKQAGYDVDHIIPKHAYDLDKESEMLKCNSIHNLRWLDSKENRSKGAKIRPQDLEIIKNITSKIYPDNFKYYPKPLI